MSDNDQLLSMQRACSEIGRVLDRLALGDPDARIALSGDAGFIQELEPLLNRLAEFVKSLVNDSHDTAMGICEHYETLLRLADGDLESRAHTDSPVELIAKLGELINLQAQSFHESINMLEAKEVELVSQAQLQKGIIDFLPDATFVIDRDHRVIAWNKAMVDISGIPEAEMLGKGNETYSVALYGEQRPLLLDMIGLDIELVRQHYIFVEERGDTLTAEGKVPHALHGAIRNIQFTASPLYGHDGAVIGAIESIRDITNIKKAEEEREQLKDQLHHVQKLDSIGKLAGGIAHEFNNILAAIIGYAGILEIRLGSDSSHLTTVNRIITAAEKAASLASSMLTFSRRNLGVPEPVSINSFIFGIQEMLARLAVNIQVEYHLAPGELVLNADAGQLRQIILNLCNNSCDAMPDGGHLTISTAGYQIAGDEEGLPSGMPPGQYVKLTVADTGHGIAPEEMSKIFDPFFTTKEVGKGAGLGLSMVFGIVQQHEGFIGVSSTPGEGTAVSIYFPGHFHAAAFGPADSASQDQEARNSATILVGEDNEDVRPMIVELLQDVGYQVLVARDGVEVVECMESHGDTVDLLLLDVIMPRMNGYQALLAVRVRHPDIPCVFLSGYSKDILSQKGEFSGEFYFLSKPIMPNKLIEAVRAALDGSKIAAR